MGAQFPDGPPLGFSKSGVAKLAPLGGSAAHEVASVGATYIGRFAPSPTGPLHAGSLAAALASWLDAKAHGGRWLIRMEDVDTPRCVPGMDQVILRQLSAFGLRPDSAVWYQSSRSAAYQHALNQLVQHGLAYPCRCSRKDIESALLASGQTRRRNAELVYPGTCRHGFAGSADLPIQAKFAWRFRTDIFQSKVPETGSRQAYTAPVFIVNDAIDWTDRRLGNQTQDVDKSVGDFPLKRSDGCTTYQLAVVVDDAAQDITHVVRGEDLADNTARQILLQRALGFATPRYLHTPLAWGGNGEKLSKQNGARALDTSAPLPELNAAAAVLGLTPAPENQTANLGYTLASWVNQWRHLYNPEGDHNNTSHPARRI